MKSKLKDEEYKKVLFSEQQTELSQKLKLRDNKVKSIEQSMAIQKKRYEDLVSELRDEIEDLKPSRNTSAIPRQLANQYAMNNSFGKTITGKVALNQNYFSSNVFGTSF